MCQPLLDEHALHDLALGPGLVRDQRHADHLLGQPLHVFHRPGDLDAAALAAAAGVDLRLDDDRQPEALRDGHGLVGVERDFAARDRHAVPGEDRLCLVFVDFHGMSAVTGPASGDAPHGQRGPPFTPPRRVETESTLGCYRAVAAASRRAASPVLRRRALAAHTIAGRD